MLWITICGLMSFALAFIATIFHGNCADALNDTSWIMFSMMFLSVCAFLAFSLIAFAYLVMGDEEEELRSSRFFILSAIFFLIFAEISFFVKSHGVVSFYGLHNVCPGWHDIFTFWRFRLGKCAIVGTAVYVLLFSAMWNRGKGIVSYLVTLLMFPVLFIISFSSERAK